MHAVCRLDTAQEQPEPELFKETKLNVDCSLSEFVTEQVHHGLSSTKVLLCMSVATSCNLAERRTGHHSALPEDGEQEMPSVLSLAEERVSRGRADPTRALHCMQAFVESKDGTKIPMFIVHRAGIQMDGSNPTLMYGYGGELLPVKHLDIEPEHSRATAQSDTQPESAACILHLKLGSKGKE